MNYKEEKLHILSLSKIKVKFMNISHYICIYVIRNNDTKKNIDK